MGKLSHIQSHIVQFLIIMSVVGGPGSFGWWLSPLVYAGDAASSAAQAVPQGQSKSSISQLENRALKLAQLLERDPEAASAYESELSRQADGEYVIALGHGMAHQKAERFDQAAAQFEKALALRPRDTRVRKLLIDACLNWAGQVKPAEAIEPLQKILRLDPNRASAWRDLGWGRWALEQYDDAIEAWEKALETGIENRDRLALLVAADFIELGQAERGLQLFLRWNPGGSFSDAGIALFRQNRLRAAERFLIEAWKRQENPLATGLYLATVQSGRTDCAAVMTYLKPALELGLDKISVNDLDMIFDVAAKCEHASQVFDLLRELEKSIHKAPAYGKRLAVLLENAGHKRTSVRDQEGAFGFYSRSLELDPDRTIWFRAFDLGQRIGKEREAAAMLESVERRASSVAIREGVRGKVHAREGRLKAAVEHFERSLEADPNQTDLRFELFQHLVTLGEFEKAETHERWFEARLKEGDGTVRTYLAEARSALGKTEEAFETWRELYLTSPEVPYYTTQYARSAVQLCRWDEALSALEDIAPATSNPQLYELIVEIEAARGNLEQVMQWTERGLRIKPTAALLRHRAEAAEALRDYTAAEQAAQALLEMDRGNAAAAGILLRSQLAQNRFDSARSFGQELLQRNPEFLPALAQLQELAAATQDDQARSVIASEVASQRPWDLNAQRRYALFSAETGKYGKALSTLGRLARIDPLQAIPILLYSRPSSCSGLERNSVDQIVSHWERLKSAGYRFIGPEEIDPGKAEARVMVVVLDPDPAALGPLDAALRRINGKAVLVTSNLALTGVDRLRELSMTGHWILASSLAPGRQRDIIDTKGTTGNVLTHLLYVDGKIETPQAFRERVGKILSRAANLPGAGKERLFVYPSGDYGQFSLDTSTDVITMLRQEVERHFDKAIIFDNFGFVSVGFDPLRLPAKPVPPQWSDEDLITHLGQANPLVMSRLDYAKALSWTRQHERAAVWFKRAEASGADPAEVSFHWGASAHQEGDVPTALSKLRTAWSLNPDSTRNLTVLRRAEDRKNTALALNGSIWEDSDDRQVVRYGAELGTYVADQLRLSVFSDRTRYEREGFGGERGFRSGGGFRWHLAPQWRLDAQAWWLNMDEVPNQVGWAMNLHIPAAALGGSLELEATRDEVYTVESVRNRIWASEFSLATYSRIANFWELSLAPSFVDRNDGNQTYSIQGHFARRLHEWPYFGLGYSFRFADSDRDPIEYWAPVELRQHQVYLASRGEYGKLLYGIALRAGYAAQKDTDWRFRWGGRPMIGLRLTSRTELRAEFIRLDTAIYHSNTWLFGLVQRF